MKRPAGLVLFASILFLVGLKLLAGRSASADEIGVSLLRLALGGLSLVAAWALWTRRVDAMKAYWTWAVVWLVGGGVAQLLYESTPLLHVTLWWVVVGGVLGAVGVYLRGVVRQLPRMSAVETAPDRFVRIGGVAILAGFLIHIVANMFLKQFPPDDPTLEELRGYLADEAATWALVHGLRYVAFTCIAVFAAALFVRTCGRGGLRSSGWGLVGLLGAALHVTNGILTNGIEVLAFSGFGGLAEEPELFGLVFRLTRVLFTGEIVAWGILIGGFSVAGWQTASLPRWLSVLGFVSAAGCIACGVFLVSILEDGAAAPLVGIVPLGCLAWFLSTGVLLVVRGAGDGR